MMVDAEKGWKRLVASCYTIALSIYLGRSHLCGQPAPPHMHTLKTEMHRRRFRPSVGSDLCSPEVGGRLLRAGYVAGALFLEKHWYLLIKFRPTLQQATSHVSWTNCAVWVSCDCACQSVSLGGQKPFFLIDCCHLCGLLN